MLVLAFLQRIRLEERLRRHREELSPSKKHTLKLHMEVVARGCESWYVWM